MRSVLRLLIAAAVIATASRADAAWHEAKSKHFIIYADDKPERLNRFAERLERFDQAVRWIRGMDDPPLTDSNRLRVYVLKSEGAVSKLIGDSMARGMYEPRASGAVAFVPRSAGSAFDEWDLDTEQIFFHEYAHHLQLQYASVALPEWVVEGFAEFFATAEIEKDGSVLVGKYPKYRAMSFFNDDGLTLEQMVGGTYRNLTAEQVDGLYARGWLLTDFLTFDKSRRGQLSKYIEGIQNGLTPLDSARAAFGDLKQFKRDFDRFATGKLTGIRVPATAISTGAIAMRPLTAGEAAIMPTHIRSTRGVDKKTAPAVAEAARKAAEAYPSDAFVQAALAEAEYDAGDYAAASTAADRALAANPNQVHALIYKGQAQIALARAKPETADWAGIRRWFLRANKLDTENAEPLALFYQTFAESGEKPTKNAVDALLYAVALAPQDEGLRIMATHELLIESRTNEAREMLAPLAYRPHSSAGFRDGMMKIMAAISAGDTKTALAILEKSPEEPADESHARR
jgi:tetratricopeptide (TPR) repeat protein